MGKKKENRLPITRDDSTKKIKLEKSKEIDPELKKKKKKKKPQLIKTSANSIQNPPNEPTATDFEANSLFDQGLKKKYSKFRLNLFDDYGELDCSELSDEFADMQSNAHSIGWDESLSSIEKGQKMFEWMIAPMSIEDFFEHFWEKRALWIRGRPNSYYTFKTTQGETTLFSQKDIAQALNSRSLKYGVHLDITKYANGKRSTLNPKNPSQPQEPVVAKSKDVWEFFEKQGCSVRMLHPQQWHDPLWMVLSVLEEFFSCQVGCNSYLTPQGSQGFSPHYDDVEAFALQTEGAKRWKLYRPLQPSHMLCRYSSKDFDQRDLPEPMVELTLETGDLLYFPRGFVHQAISVPDRYSHHVTLSTGLKNTWYDFMDLVIPQALSLAFEEDLEFRKSLPRDCFKHVGVLHSQNEEDPEQQAFDQHFLKLYNKLVDHMPLDTSMDQWATQFCHQRMKPHPCLVGSVSSGNVTVDSLFRLSIASAVTISSDEEKVTLYSPMKNDRELHAKAEVHISELSKENFKLALEFPVSWATAIEHIIDCYPDYLSVKAIPQLPSDTHRLELVSTLVKHGICVLKHH